MTMLKALGGLALTATLAAGAAAMEKPEGYGERPLTMIVPYGAGGGSDQLARTMAAALEETAGPGRRRSLR